jgi:hypothetical protein
VCGDEGVLAVDVVVKAAEIATFAAAHAGHDRFDIHLRLAASDGRLATSTVLHRHHARFDDRLAR